MTSSAIDLRVLPNNIPSLCIPRVFSNIDEKRIRRIFGELNMGDIERVDIISKTTEKGDKFNRVFIHFKNWFRNVNADMARERLLNGKEIKIIYDEPWFWKVSAYREVAASSRPSKPRPQEKKKATLQFDSDSDDENVKKSPYKPSSTRDTSSPMPQRRIQEPRRIQEVTKYQRGNKSKPVPSVPVPSVPVPVPVPVPILQRNVAKTHVPRSPSNTPPRERLGADVDLASIVTPNKTTILAAEQLKEEGEI